MSNKIKIKIILVILMLLIMVFACLVVIFMKSDNAVLEYSNISSFDVVETSVMKNNRKYLIISGECNSSSLNTGEIKDSLENRDMVVRVYTTLSRTNNKDGSFVHAIKINNNIDRILFGDEKKVIWTRN